MVNIALLHNFPPSYPHSLWITRFLATPFLLYISYPHYPQSFPAHPVIHIHCGQLIHTIHNGDTLYKLSTKSGDNFSTLSTELLDSDTFPQNVGITFPHYPQHLSGANTRQT